MAQSKKNARKSLQAIFKASAGPDGPLQERHAGFVSLGKKQFYFILTEESLFWWSKYVKEDAKTHFDKFKKDLQGCVPLADIRSVRQLTRLAKVKRSGSFLGKKRTSVSERDGSSEPELSERVAIATTGDVLVLTCASAEDASEWAEVLVATATDAGGCSEQATGGGIDGLNGDGGGGGGDGGGDGSAVSTWSAAAEDDGGKKKHKHGQKEEKKKLGGDDAVVRREGFLAVKQSNRRSWCVLEGTNFVWYLSKKDIAPVGELSLMDCTIDMYADVLFLQIGTIVYDITCADEEEARSWKATFEQALSYIKGVEKRTPLYRYRNRDDHAVRVMLELPGGVSQTMGNVAQTPSMLKQAAFAVATESGLCDSSVAFHNPDFYFLQIAGTDYYLMAEDKPVAAEPLIRLLIASFCPILVRHVSKMELRDSGVDIRAVYDRQQLVQFDEAIALEERSSTVLVDESYWNSIAASFDEPDSEMHMLRFAMAQYRSDSGVRDVSNRLNEYTESEPLPTGEGVPQQLVATCYLAAGVVKSLQLDVSATAPATRAQLYEALLKNKGDAVVSDTVDDYLLKVNGYRSYLASERPLSDYDCVRNAMAGRSKLALTLVPLRTQVTPAHKRVPIELLDAAMAGNAAWVAAASVRSRDPAYRGQLAIDAPLVVRVAALRWLPSEVAGDDVFVHVGLYHGGKALDPPRETAPLRVAAQQNQVNAFDGDAGVIRFGLAVGRVPLGARLSFTLVSKTHGPLGWVSLQVYDHVGRLLAGSRQLRCWRGGAADPVGNCAECYNEKQPMRLYVDVQSGGGGGGGGGGGDAAPIFYRQPSEPCADEVAEASVDDVPAAVMAAANADALTELSAGIRPQLWKWRRRLTHLPRALPRVLQCCSWTDVAHVAEVEWLLANWTPLEPTEALELFDAYFSYPPVRAYAVQCLDRLSEQDLADLLLQLVQVLKYEPHHDSPLARFLLRRASVNHDQIGQPLFWMLRSEIHVPEISQRYLLLIECYVRGCHDVYRTQLINQIGILDEFTRIATQLCEEEDENRKPYLREELTRMRFPPRFTLPLFPDMECSGLVIDKCRHMKSKKMPLWLHFANADEGGPPVAVLYKVGDDLRQDVLTLQMIKLMGKLWLRGGMELHLSPYGVVATGDERGLVEVVLNSNTTAGINRDAGGALQVLSSDVLTKWLRQHNPSDEEFAVAQRRFALSCAGYCVATFVLGVGDRHNDNIMMSKRGELFHIDFGHFLGHFKSKFGYKREKAPFVFTHQYEHVLGGKQADAYRLFEETAIRAYNLVRANANLFINLFVMMLSIGLEELRSKDNIKYLREQLVLDLDDEQAAAHLKAQIEEARSSKRTAINDIVHIWKN